MSQALNILSKKFLDGRLSRREFLEKASKLSLGLTLSSLASCVYSLSDQPRHLEASQEVELRAVLNTLFPKDSNSPGADEIGALDYFRFVLIDPGVEQAHKNLIVDGIGWLNEDVRELGVTKFSALEISEQESLIEKIIEEDWGETWCSRLIGYLFEALLCDPIYGGNKNMLGWKWLEHVAGAPRPQPHNRYPKLLQASSKSAKIGESS